MVLKELDEADDAEDIMGAPNSLMNNARVLCEVALAVALAEFGVMFLLPMIAPGANEWVQNALDAMMLPLIAGPIVLWRLNAAAPRGTAPSHSGSSKGSWRLRAATVILVVAGSTLAIAPAIGLNRSIESEANARFHRMADREASDIAERVNRPVYGLNGARGVFAASEKVERLEFRNYVESRDLAREFPGAMGFGFIKRVMRDDLESFLARERDDNAPGFTIHGSATPGSALENAPDLYVVSYIDPVEPNFAALGYDVGSEPKRRAAIEKAIATGEPTISARVALLQDRLNRAEFLYYVPVYRNGTRPTTAEERFAALEGVVYAPVVLEEALAELGAFDDGQLNILIYDGDSTDETNLLYDRDEQTHRGLQHEMAAGGASPLFVQKQLLHIGGRTWTAVVHTTPLFESSVNRWIAPVVGVVGVLLNVLAGAMFWNLAAGKARAMALARSITEDLAASLREVKAFRTAIESVAIISEADSRGKIVDVNDRFCAISGYSREELLGQDHRIVNSGTHPKSFWTNMWKLAAGGHAWRGDVCNRAKDGSLYWVDSIIAPFLGADGKVNRYVSIRMDITARKQTEQQLAMSEALLRETGRASGVGGWELDVAAGTVAWTEQTRRIHEVDDDYQPTLESAIEFYAPSARPLIAEAVRQARESGVPWDLELPFVTATGREIWVRAVGRAEMKDGRAVRLYGAFQDVTESRNAAEQLRKARHAAEAANRSKSEFLANMSHEIRTPLTAILGFADLLRDDGDRSLAPARRIETIETIRIAGQHLLTIINDILDLSKIEADKLHVEAVETPIGQVIREVVSLMQPHAKAKGLNLRASLDSPVPERIMSDPTRLRQILMNLVGNAVKFTDAGSVTVSVRAQVDENARNRADTPREWLVIDVEDTGSGMTSQQVDRLFHAFVQADNSESRKHGGTGLGLTISRRLAMLMGGGVSIARTAPGQGSTFRLELPLVPAAGAKELHQLDPQATVPLVKQENDATRLHGRILLAEDGIDNQRLFAFLLKKAGAKVDVAENGVVALRMLEAAALSGSPYDLLLTDMQMPEMDGYTLARTLRERGSRLAIVALTAHAMAEDRAKCREAGCDDYASKPIDKAALLAVCAKWMGRKGGEVPRSAPTTAAA